MNQTAPPAADIAFVIPLEKFVYKHRGAWNVTTPVGERGIKAFLVDAGWRVEDVNRKLKEFDFVRVYGHDMAPGKGELYLDEETQRPMLNTWVRPPLQPVQGEYARIRRVLEWLTKGDEGGIRWLTHWMALKIQNPELVPKVAVVLATQQGGGKGTLAFLMRQMLGDANTAIVKREELGNKFNKRWIDKLFVLGDEVLSNESLKDISNLLKVLIDGNEIELEGKGEHQRAINNRLAWMFASNDRIAPVVLEKGDRRYSVFSNHDPLPSDYVDMLNTSFEADRKTPTPDFAAEISAFFYDLLHLEVDRTLVRMPYKNEAREALIQANRPTQELFIEHVNEVGLQDMLTALADQKSSRSMKSPEELLREWNIGADEIDNTDGVAGIAASAVYECYQEYCRQTGGKPLKQVRFATAVRNSELPWAYHRPWVARLKRQVGVYVLPKPTVKNPAAA